MYSVFEKLCKEKGVTPSAVAIACGFAPSVVSRWKSGESNPKADKLKKIADYFGVSVTYLMVGEDVRATIEGDFADMLRMSSTDRIIEGNNDLKLLFETVKDAPTDVLVRLRYYAEGLLAARKDSV